MSMCYLDLEGKTDMEVTRAVLSDDFKCRYGWHATGTQWKTNLFFWESKGKLF